MRLRPYGPVITSITNIEKADMTPTSHLPFMHLTKSFSKSF